MGLEYKSNTPGWLVCAMGGAIIFILLASFTGVNHVADELMWMGLVLGMIFFVSGGYDLSAAELGTMDNSGWD